MLQCGEGTGGVSVRGAVMGLHFSASLWQNVKNRRFHLEAGAPRGSRLCFLGSFTS